MSTTHASKIAHIIGIALFVFTMTVFCRQAWSGEYRATVNPYSENEMHDQGTALLDAVDQDHPVAITGTFNSPYLTDDTITQSTEEIDRVDRVAPPVIAGTVNDPRIPGNTEDDSTNLIDVVDHLYPSGGTALK